MLGLGKYVKMYKAWRKLRPVINLFGKDKDMGSKLKSRKLWLVAGLALLGSVMTQLGMDPEQWGTMSEWLLKMTAVYVGGNAVEHVTEAIKAKKAG